MTTAPRRYGPLLKAIVFCLAALPAPITAASPPLSVPYVATPVPTVERMLKLASVGPGDTIYDLGSGDGRLVITAVQQFAASKGVGVDIDPRRIEESRDNAKLAGVADRVTFVEGDLFKFDFREADVLTLYLLPRINLKLRPKILAWLEPGSRVVSHGFSMKDWEPDVRDGDIMLWIVPAEVEGTWTGHAGGKSYSLRLSQTFQRVAGTLATSGRNVTLNDVHLKGRDFAFAASAGDGRRPIRFEGRVEGAEIEGLLSLDGTEHPLTLARDGAPKPDGAR
jgi:hypothetical protein